MVPRTTRIEFTNHLMFNAVLTENEDLCRRVISAILDKEVQSIEYLDDEHELQPEIDARGAQLDVLALIDGEYVDIEMQVGEEPDIERRCRFYHSAIAARYTPKGKGYRDVPQSYVIFLCLNDPLGAGLPRYELATSCLTAADVRVDDGARTILLNALAWERETNPEVAGVLQYALTGCFAGGLARDIACAVDDKNLDRRWVRASMGVMTYEHEFLVLRQALDEKREELAAAEADVAAALDKVDTARAEADTARARERLSRRLYDAGRIDEYFAALEDSELMEALLDEFFGEPDGSTSA